MYGFQPVLWSQRFWKHDTTIIYRDQPQFYKEAQGGAKIKSPGKKGSIHLVEKNEVGNGERGSLSKGLSNTGFGINSMFGCFRYSNQGCVLIYWEEGYMQRLERSQVRVPSPVYIFSDCCGIVWLNLIYIPEII